jgi:hypothetical protein
MPLLARFFTMPAPVASAALEATPSTFYLFVSLSASACVRVPAREVSIFLSLSPPPLVVPSKRGTNPSCMSFLQ